MKQTLEAEAQANKDILASLQKSLDNLTLRHGLLVTEKKASDHELDQVDKDLKQISQQFEDDRKEWATKIDEMKEALQKKEELLDAADTALKDLKTTNQEIHARCRRMAHAKKDLDEVKLAFENFKKQATTQTKQHQVQAAKDEKYYKSQLTAFKLRETDHQLMEDRVKSLDAQLIKSKSLEHANSHLLKNAAGLQKELAGANKEIGELKKVEASYEKLKQEMKGLDQKHQDAVRSVSSENLHMAHIAAAQHLVKAKNIEIKTRDDAIKDLKLKLDATKPLKSALEELEAKYKSQQGQVQKLEKCFRMLPVKNFDEANKLNNKVTKLENDTKAQNQELEELNTQVANMEIETRAAARAKEAMETELSAANREKETLQNKSLTLEQQLALCQLELKSMKSVKRDSAAIETKLKEEVKKSQVLTEQVTTAEETLKEERKKIQTLGAENARLAFQQTIDKGSFDAQKKSLWREVQERRQEIERLEADVHRLAVKLAAAGKIAAGGNVTSTYPFATPSPEAIAALKTRAEEPENFVHRNAPFDYKVTPNLDHPATAAAQTRDRIQALEDQLYLYRVILTDGNKMLNAPGIRHKLIQTGLYMGAPTKTYVKPEYYREVHDALARIEEEGVTEEEMEAYGAMGGSKWAKPEEEEDEMIVDDVWDF